MRKIFHGYYQPSDAKFDNIWSEGLLVSDTSVLLHLFRFMPKQRGEVLAAESVFGEFRHWTESFKVPQPTAPSDRFRFC